MATSPLAFLDPGRVADHQAQIAAKITAAARNGALAIVGSAALPAKCARGLAEAGAPPRLLIEYEPRAWGRQVEGLPVMGARAAFDLLGPDAVVIAGIWSPQHAFVETRAWLGFHGFSQVLPVHAAFWTAGATIGPHYQLAEPGPLAAAAAAATEVHDQLADEESRRQFAGHLRWRTSLDAAYLPAGDKRRAYFGESFLTLADDACIVDVGAFDGDSLRSFLLWRERCRVFHALEPDPISFARLSQYIDRLPPDVSRQVRPTQLAAGAAAGTVRIGGTGKPGSTVGNGDGADVPCVRLADHFRNERVDYLKFDIEGAEQDALDGAWDIFARDRPAAAVAIYHKPMDIVTLPLELIRHSPGSRYYVRSHDNDGIDLVFYAVPQHPVPHS